MVDESKAELERLKKFYADELKRKDKIIAELREQNVVIMKSALKQSERINELTDKLRISNEKLCNKKVSGNSSNN